VACEDSLEPRNSVDFRVNQLSFIISISNEAHLLLSHCLISSALNLASLIMKLQVHSGDILVEE
jgi:hypothetical protein